MKKTLIAILFLSLVLVMISFQSCEKPERITMVRTEEIIRGNNTAIIKGYIIDLSDAHHTDHGFIIYLEEKEVARLSLGEPTAVGEFTDSISNLQPNTEFTIRSFVTENGKTIVSDDYKKYLSGGGQTVVVEVFNPATGRTWMDRNLGASRAATSSNDAQAYGDLYQWGRGTDGHEKRTSGTTLTLSTNNSPGHSNFILADNSPYDWRNPQNDNLWQGAEGVNNPCPTGFRLPTAQEWDAERMSWSSNDAAGAFASPLKLAVAGYRTSGNGTIDDVGLTGDYWSSTTTDGTGSRDLFFDSKSADLYNYRRALGSSVRCIKDSEPQPVTYTLSLQVSPSDSGQVTGAGNYTAGTTVTITATPNAGFQFINWSGDSDYLVDSTATTPTLTMPAQSIGLTANLEASIGETEVVEVFNPTTGKIWMDRNLGARRAATSSTDALAYGDLYQWGRSTDGHEKRTSGTTTTLSNGDTPGHSNFILAPDTPDDWRSPQNNNLWQGVSGINNPCPEGFRLPTEAEWEAELLSWSSNNAAGAFASPLKLPVAGYRSGSYGSLSNVGSHGYYWSSTVDGTRSRQLYFKNGTATVISDARAYGYSVRCLKDN